MKAIHLERYGSADCLKLEDTECPSQGDDEVLIEVQAASVNDWDWGIVQGSPFYIRLLCGLFRPKKINILGVDVAGYVKSVGPCVKALKPGDRVYGDLSECGFGAFAEYVCAPEKALTQIPPEMSFQEAAALPHASMLAIQALFDVGKLKPDHKLLINGAGGGVGTLAVQIAKSTGVTNITGVDHHSKFEMMKSIGYDRCIDYEKVDFTTMNETYDLIIDTRTNRPVYKYQRTLKPDGIYATVGANSFELFQLLLLAPILNSLSSRKLKIVALKTNKDMQAINDLYKKDQIKPVLDNNYPLGQTSEAVRHFGSGQHKGKIIIDIQKK